MLIFYRIVKLKLFNRTTLMIKYLREILGDILTSSLFIVVSSSLVSGIRWLGSGP